MNGLPAASRWAPKFLGEVKLAQAPLIVMAPVWNGPTALVLGPSSWGFGGIPTAFVSPIPWPRTVRVV